MVVKEKPQEGIPEAILKEIRELGQAQQRWEQEQRERRPAAPDESGEIGIYDEVASNWFGGAFIYKTDSGRYFSLVSSDEYRFLEGVNFETYLRSLQRSKK